VVVGTEKYKHARRELHTFSHAIFASHMPALEFEQARREKVQKKIFKKKMALG
jgi:hypothetical protein